MAPIKDDVEFVQCLEALISWEKKVKTKFLLLPEDPNYQHTIQLRRLVRDYLNTDLRLGELQYVQ